LLLAGCVAGAGYAGAVTRSPERILSLAVNPAAGAGPLTGADLAARTGARGALLSYTWSELEPAPGRYALSQFKGLRYFAEQRGLKVLLGLQVVDTTVKSVPTDLVGTPFDARLLKERFHRLVDALRPHLSENVAYVSVGNGVDMYLARNPGAWPAYREFYADAVRYLHASAPWIKVGATATFSGLVRKARGRMADLNRLSDVELATYFPVHGDFVVRAPSAPLADLPRLLRLAGGRPLLLAEVGYPDASELDSSEARQAAFVRNVFTAWKRAGARLPFLNFLFLHDPPATQCDAATGFYGHAGNRFRAFFCSLGLRRANGTPKRAWAEVVRGAAGVRPP
jgi:hypothetical protein